MQIKINDPVNSFTHRVEQISQVKGILERLRTTNSHIINELKNTADNLESNIEFKNMDSEEVNSDAYALTLMKMTVSLCLRSCLCYNAMREYLNCFH